MAPHRRDRSRAHRLGRSHIAFAATFATALGTAAAVAAPSATAGVTARVSVARPAAAPASSPADSAAVLPAGPIGHAGRWITDATGKVMLVAGVNMVNKLTPYTPAADGFDDADAAFLAAGGLDAVRVGVLWEAVEPHPGVFDDNYLASIKSTVALLAAHGIVSLLDFHQDMYNEKYQGEGEPAWAADDGGLPAVPQTGFPGNYFDMPALQAAYDNFWADATVDGEGLQDWYAGAAAHVASYFNGTPGILGLDLFNEPSPGPALLTCFTPAVGCPALDGELTSFYAKVDQAVRSVNASALLFGEPWMSFDVGSPSALGSTGDKEQGFSFHDYCPSDDLSTSLNITCPPFDAAVFGNAENVSARTGDALLLTEFGATSDANVLSSVVAAAARDKVGWTEWAYCQCSDPTGQSGEGLVNNPASAPTGSNVNSAALAALAVPHPELVAGTPQSYGYDTSTSTFSLSYAVQRADGTGAFPAGSPTSIAVPATAFPGGYAVSVTGGRVSSAGGVLTIDSCSGAAAVSVTVKPGSGVTATC